MAGLVLHLGASVTCSHGGPAVPTVPYSRVTLAGHPVVTVAAPYTIAHCNLAAPAEALLFIEFLSAATVSTAFLSSLIS